MDALDFIFNGQRLSDFGFIIASFGEDGDVTPGGISYTTTNTPNSDRKLFSSIKVDSTVVFNFSIAKLDCTRQPEPIDRYEESAISKWLEREDGFHQLHFCQDGYENIYYNAYITSTPVIIAGRTYGYKLTATTDNKYAYDFETEYELDTEANIECSFIVSSDKTGYIYPQMEITPYESGNLSLEIKEDVNQSFSVFRNVVAGETIKLDCELGIAENIGDTDNFNWIFPRFLQGYDDTFNTIITTLPCHIKINYVPRRKVVM